MRPVTRLLSVIAFALALSACSVNLNTACQSSTECATGYTCDLAAKKCVAGATKPEVSILTDLTPTFTGHLVVQMSVADQKSIDSVSVAFGTHPAVNATNTAGTTWKADIDTKGQAITDETATLTVTAKNSAGASATATAANVHVDNVGPAVTSATVSPSTVFPGQPTTIVFQTGEAITQQPTVSLTPPGVGAQAHYAQFVSVSGTSTQTWTFSFASLTTDPAGAWNVSVAAEDALHNVTVAGAASQLTVQAEPPGAGLALSASGGAQGVGTELKIASSAILTATFAKPLLGGQIATAYLCPVAAGNPSCLSTTTGALPLTPTGAPGQTTYTFPVAPPAIAPQPGQHVVTVKGTNVSGETLTADIIFDFDFTVPVLNGVDFVAADVGNRDSSGYAMFTTAPTGSARKVHAAVLLTEAPAPGTLVVNLDETTPGTGTALTASVEQPDPYGAPEFYVILDGTALLDGTHTLTAHVKDLAGNDATPVSTTFLVKSTDPVVSNTAFSLDTSTAPANVRGGMNLLVQAWFDRPVAAWRSLPMTMARATGGSFALIPYASTTASCGGGTCNVYQFVGTAPSGSSNDGTYNVSLGGGISDSFGNPIAAATSGGAINVDNTAPTVSFITPLTAINAATTYVFNAGETINGSISYCVDPTPTAGDPCGGAGLAASAVVGQPTRGQFTVTPPASTQANHTLVAVYTDAAGNVGFASVQVRYDTVRPTLTSFSWNRTVVGPSNSAILTVTASEPITAPSLGTSGFTGVAVGAAVPTGSSGNSYTFNVTMPATCNGGVNPNDGTPFSTTVSFSDLAGNPILNAASSGSLTCVATPVVLASSWNRTVAGPFQQLQLTVTLNEPANLAINWFSGTSPVYNVSGQYLSQTSTTGGYTYLVNYTFSACNGAVVGGRQNPFDSVPFQPFLQVAPSNGGVTSQVALPGTLTCVNNPTIVSTSFNPSSAVAGPGGTVTLTVVTNVPMSSIGAAASGATAGTAVAVGGTGTQWNIPLTMPATACAPMPDGNAVPVSVSGTTTSGNGLATFAGQITCSESRVTGTTANNFSLRMAPYSDGVVRTFINATSAAVQGSPALNGLHVEVTDYYSGLGLVGTAPVASDGSIAPFMLTSNVVQPRIEIVDLLGNRTTVGPFPQQIELNFEGKGASVPADAGVNTISAFNVTGSSGWFAPDIWLDGGVYSDGGSAVYPAAADAGRDSIGPLPDGGITELSTTCPADGGNGPVYCGLADPDGQLTVVSGGGTADAGSAWVWDRYTVLDGGPNLLTGNYLRQESAIAALGNTIYLYGGCTSIDGGPPGPPGQCMELDGGLGVMWAMRIGQDQTCQADGGCTVGAGWQQIPPADGGQLAVNFYQSAMLSDGVSLYVMGGLDTAGNNASHVLKYDPASAIWSDTGDIYSGYYFYSATNSAGQSVPYSVTIGATTCSGVSKQIFQATGSCQTYLTDVTGLCAGTNIRPFYVNCGTQSNWGFPQGFYGGTLVWDSTSQRLWMFGGQGTVNNGTTYITQNALYQGVWSGTSWSWSLVSPVGTLPPARTFAQGFWDPATGRLVVVGGWGNSAQTIPYYDTWEYSPSSNTWRDATDKAPAARSLQNVPSSQGNYYPPLVMNATLNQQGGGGAMMYGYYTNQPLYTYANDLYVLRREIQQRVLVKATFPLPSGQYQFSPFPSLTNFNIEVSSDNVDPNAEILIWDGWNWDFVSGATRRNQSWTVDSLAPQQPGNNSPYSYFGSYPFVNPSGNTGTVYLLVKRAPGSTAGGAANARSLNLDDLRVRINFK